MAKKIILFVVAFSAWLLLSCSVDFKTLVIGVLGGVFVVLLTADIFPDTVRLPQDIRCYLRFFFQYIPLFIWECIKANIDGLLRVAHPNLPINPGIVKVKTTLKSDAALTFLANSLTLKPGTITVDIDKENGFLYIHWVDVRTQDVSMATEYIVRKFERVLQRIFE